MNTFPKGLLVLAVAAVAAGCSDEKPSGTLDRFVAAKPVVSRADMRPLISTLLRGDIAGFDRMRTGFLYAGKRLDFRGQTFAGLSLVGANLSNSILAGVDFTGANLDRVSFRGSYVATASFARTYSLETDVPTNVGRPVSLVQADFTGSVVKAKEYYYFAENFVGWVEAETVPEGIGQADCSKAIGIPPLGLRQTSLTVTGRTKLVGKPTTPQPERRPSEIEESCANPYLDLDGPNLQIWQASGMECSALTNRPAIRIHGQFYGAGSVNVVNNDPSLVLVIGSDFGGHGDIYSKGAVVVDGAHLMGSVFAEGPVWLRNNAFPRRTVVGEFIFAEKTTNCGQGRSWLSPVIRVPPVATQKTDR